MDTGTSERIIFLIDMDAFFASVEMRENPKLMGKPVIVVGSASPRSVVCAANYEVRKFGVHSAMSYSKALRLCPHAEVIEARPELYRKASKNIFSVCETFTDLLEISSIDECYMDLTPTAERFGGPVEAARKLKRKIFDTEGLNCTIGIGPNKLVAKLASELKKPNGLSWVKSADVPALFETLPISALHGIGGKTAGKLRSMGITTAADLGRADRTVLRKTFGINGDRLAEMGLGRDDSPVIPYYERPQAKSVSHEHTLGDDTRDYELLSRTLRYLSERVAYRLRKSGLSAKNVGITVRFNDLQRITRSRSLSDHTNDGLAIFQAALPLLKEALKDTRPVRLVGVSTGDLLSGGGQQGLFDDPRKKDLTDVVDLLNERFGKLKVKPASLVDTEENDHITFKG